MLTTASEPLYYTDMGNLLIVSHFSGEAERLEARLRERGIDVFLAFPGENVDEPCLPWKPSSPFSSKSLLLQVLQKGELERLVCLHRVHPESGGPLSFSEIEERVDTCLKGWLFLLKEAAELTRKSEVVLVLDADGEGSSPLVPLLEAGFLSLLEVCRRMGIPARGLRREKATLDPLVDSILEGDGKSLYRWREIRERRRLWFSK
ncbi:hypothetical protein STHERM_c00220 [Spirochaeta thermophila DSM 6192]|uniref:Uncharacterized protein n=2 Tax=Winmispira thermophila TaxID=154 RepID=E0RTD2_WINT6|nr:hypothetical protein STHERM_c00220 [Spirochaeta thermophila DSM 6192]